MIDVLNLPIHHIGIACKSIDSELPIFQTLGFSVQDSFIDSNQGIKGTFITKKDKSLTPYCFELLENLSQSGILDSYLKNNTKMYHIAFVSQNIESTLDKINSLEINGGGDKMKGKIKRITPIMQNEYFLKLCFVMLPNRLLIEFVELNNDKD